MPSPARRPSLARRRASSLRCRRRGLSDSCALRVARRLPRPLTNRSPASCSLGASRPWALAALCRLILCVEAIGHVPGPRRKVRLFQSALHAGRRSPLIVGEHISDPARAEQGKPLEPRRAPLPPAQRETQVNICSCPALIKATREHCSPPAFSAHAPLPCSFGHRALAPLPTDSVLWLIWPTTCNSCIAAYSILSSSTRTHDKPRCAGSDLSISLTARLPLVAPFRSQNTPKSLPENDTVCQTLSSHNIPTTRPPAPDPLSAGLFGPFPLNL